MIIRIFLIVAIAAIVMWFLNNRKTAQLKAGKKIGVVLLCIFAIITVVFPVLTDDIAHAFGVGRGADLLLYLLTITFIAYVLNQYLHNKDEEQKLVQLARKIALLEAQQKKS